MDEAKASSTSSSVTSFSNQSSLLYCKSDFTLFSKDSKNFIIVLFSIKIKSHMYLFLNFLIPYEEIQGADCIMIGLSSSKIRVKKELLYN